MMVRALVKTAVGAATHWSGAARRLSVLGDLPLVITYHRVVADFAANVRGTEPAMLISDGMLERHLDWVGRRFHVVGLDELGGRLERGEPFDRPVAAITFDDGYADVYENAFPLLKRKGIPAAFFVTTDVVGTSDLQLHDKLYVALARAVVAWSSPGRELRRVLVGLSIGRPEMETIEHAGGTPSAMARALQDVLPRASVERVTDALGGELALDERGLRALRPVTWEMLAEMSRAGMTIGSHSRTHALLTQEARDRALEEIAGSRRALEGRLGRAIHHFAYPAGRFDGRIVSLVAASGYRYAYTTCRHRDPQYPWLTIPRRVMWQRSSVNAFGRFSSAMMSCQVQGTFDFKGRCAPHGLAAAGAR
jgi:peptidoglycan/xylan/chitin deacetylase (PgdA/CDA1 family)